MIAWSRLACTYSLHALSSPPLPQISYNAIETYDAIHLEVLGSLEHLDTVYLEHNPIASDYEYRQRVKAGIPSLHQIDATACR